MDRVRSIVIALTGALAAAGCGVAPVRSPAVPGPPQRIVSLAPSLTETLFALGLGDRVVGVTRFCAHPPKARELPQVGGYLDPNYEALVALEPDLVVLIPSSAETGRRLESLGIPVLPVDQHDRPGATAGNAGLDEHLANGTRLGGRAALHQLSHVMLHLAELSAKTTTGVESSDSSSAAESSSSPTFTTTSRCRPLRNSTSMITSRRSRFGTCPET